MQKLLDNVDGYDTVVPGHIPVTTPTRSRSTSGSPPICSPPRAGPSRRAERREAAASIDLTGQYEGYRTERMAAAIAAIYEELGQ